MNPTLDDEQLWSAFASRTLPPAGWTHTAHLRVAWMHVRRWPDPHEAHLRMRVGIIRLNAFHGLEETAQRGYHDTLTWGWLACIRAADAKDRAAGRAAADSHEFVAAHDEFADRKILVNYYTRDRINSVEARARVLEPDLAPLPA